MFYEAQLSEPTELVIVLRDLNGAPVTGIVAADITAYLRKPGDAFTAKTVDGTNFTELDATNAPGYYSLTLASSDVDTRGDLAFIIQENGSVSLARQDLRVRVTDHRNLLLRSVGLSQENMRITDHVYDTRNNLTAAIVRIYASASDTVAQINPLAAYTLTATYDSEDRLVDYRVEKSS